MSPLLCIAAFSLLFASCQDRIAPAMNPRVVVDDGRIAKRSVTAVEGIGAIACLQRCALKRGGEVELIAVGTQGYARLDSATFAVRRVVAFPAAVRSGPMVMRDLDGDGGDELVVDQFVQSEAELRAVTPDRYGEANALMEQVLAWLLRDTHIGEA